MQVRFHRKAWLLLASILLGLLYALPNLYGEDPAIQIMPNTFLEGAAKTAFLDTLKASLASENITQGTWEEERNALLLRLPNTITQLAAHDVLEKAKSVSQVPYTVALNLAPATPSWLLALGAKPMKLGLDLRGGVHFLIEVNVDTAFKKRMESFVADLRTSLREAKLRYTRIALQGLEITIALDKPDSLPVAASLVRRRYQDLETTIQEESGTLTLAFSQAALQEIRNYTLEQTITTLRNRVNELGVSEAVVQRQGLNKVVVELPGIQDTARAKDLIGKTATLQFLMRDDEHDIEEAVAGKVPAGSRLYYTKAGRPVLLRKQEILSGDSIISATTGTDRDGMPAVSIRVGGPKLSVFRHITQQNVGKQMAVVYQETKVDTVEENGETVKKIQVIESVISLATIQSALGSQFQITGLSLDEASNLAILLRAGAMPAQVSIVEERTVGPSLGQENIRMGVISIITGMVLVLLFTWAYYSTFGLIADVALLLNVVFLIAIQSLIGATLTLPGMAAIVLTVGMAVDANVLIFERIREELRLGNSPQSSILAGFERAWATILDSNLTTLIVGLILFGVGSGPIRGFAVSLCIGIITSMFTAVTVTRAIIDLLYGGKRLAKVPVGA